MLKRQKRPHTTTNRGDLCKLESQFICERAKIRLKPLKEIV